MKWLFALALAVIIFGGAAWFGYNLFYKQEIAVEKEQRGETKAEPTPDVGLPEFEAAAKLRQDGKLPEARSALTTFIQRYPTGAHADEAKDLLGEINIGILLSRTPSPGKQEYIVRPGDVLQNVARKVKSTPELIMKMNNLNGTMLRINERLLISHPEFSLFIQRKAKVAVLLDHGNFFKQYHIREEKLGPKQPTKVMTKVAGVMAWKEGKQVGFGTKEYLASTRWIRLNAPAYTIYSVADGAHPRLEQAAPPSGLGLAATDVTELSGLVNKNTPVSITD
jgi:LysM domain